MTTVGIICEYDPFHNGHEKQIRQIRAQFGEESRIVCLMSGDFVQRGEPAVFDKRTRAKAAAHCGADVVLELPVNYALSSAEGFAAGGVSVLTALGVEYLAFGCETDDSNLLMSTAKLLLQPQTDEAIRASLKSGISYAAAREQAVLSLCPQSAEVLRRPNDILAVEYCKAILRQSSPMKVFPVHREGDYHAELPDAENPSATAIRNLLAENRDISPYIPTAAYAEFRDAKRYFPACGERAMMARLTAMTEENFSKVPYGSEGLWRRFMRACRDCSDTQSIIDATKSKRYARARIQRMLLCAVLGITEDDLRAKPSYVRILAFSEQGREVLRCFKQRYLPLIGATETVRNSDFYELEQRCERMFALFRQ